MRHPPRIAAFLAAVATVLGLSLSPASAAPAQAPSAARHLPPAHVGGHRMNLPGLIPASCPGYTGYWYYVVDNYGGNATGYMENEGQGQKLRAMDNLGCLDGLELWTFDNGTSSGWSIIRNGSTASGEQCASEGNGYYIYALPCASPPPTWQQFSIVSIAGYTNVWSFGNRYYAGNWITAVSWADPAVLQGHTGNSNGRNDWETINA